VTPEIMKLSDTSKISETLINLALEKGVSAEQIDKAMEEVKV
jgi:hypothetical protein